MYGYDAAGRLKSVNFEDGTRYEYAYDSRSHRILEKNASHERRLAYDALGRVEEVMDVTLGKASGVNYFANLLALQ